MTYKKFRIVGFVVTASMVIATIYIADALVSKVVGYSAAVGALYTTFIFRPRR